MYIQRGLERREATGFIFDDAEVARSRIWFDAIKDLPNRTRGITKQRRKGKATEWEAPLVQALGVDWRHQRGTFGLVTAWIKHCEGLIKQLLLNGR